MDSKNSLELAKMHNSAQETRDYAFKMEAVKKNLMPPVDKEKKLRDACEGFESIFIQKMWEQMRATIPEGNFLKGREEKFWQSMYDQELAKTMAGAGGIGLADMMYEQLSRSLSSASKHTADAAGARPSGFSAEITPAPLMSPPSTQAAPPPQASATADKGAAPAGQHKAPALANLYSEAVQPNAAPDLPRNAERQQAPAHAAPGVAAAQPATEDATDPAIIAVLNELRSAHQAGAAGQQASGLSLGARPPLAPMQGDRHNQTPEPDLQANYVSTLAKPVRKPVSGKHAVLPRVPAGQPVNRNLPFTPDGG